MNKKQILFTLFGILSLSSLASAAVVERSKRGSVTPPPRTEKAATGFKLVTRSAGSSPIYLDIDGIYSHDDEGTVRGKRSENNASPLQLTVAKRLFAEFKEAALRARKAV